MELYPDIWKHLLYCYSAPEAPRPLYMLDSYHYRSNQVLKGVFKR